MGGLGISSDGDDRMQPKVKTQKNFLGLPAKPKKIPGPKNADYCITRAM